MANYLVSAFCQNNNPKKHFVIRSYYMYIYLLFIIDVLEELTFAPHTQNTTQCYTIMSDSLENFKLVLMSNSDGVIISHDAAVIIILPVTNMTTTEGNPSTIVVASVAGVILSICLVLPVAIFGICFIVLTIVKSRRKRCSANACY